ncbi:MAG: glycosyltransferase [Rubrivivax sp.]
MKWGTKYGPEYVNRLHAMVRRHLAGPARFVCLTDDARGVHDDVECLPLPSLDLAPGADRGWPKLTTFTADLHGLRGRALFMDLDVVIVGDVTPFFEAPGDFLIIKDWKRPWRVTGNSSVYRFEIGAHVDVLQHFVEHQAEVRAQHRNEQEYLSHALHAQGKLHYWPAGWCRSFKYHCIPRWPSNYWRAPTVPPGTRIVIFHGEVNPPDALAGRRNRRWRHMLPAAWVAQHWTE